MVLYSANPAFSYMPGAVPMQGGAGFFDFLRGAKRWASRGIQSVAPRVGRFVKQQLLPYARRNFLPILKDVGRQALSEGAEFIGDSAKASLQGKKFDSQAAATKRAKRVARSALRQAQGNVQGQLAYPAESDRIPAETISRLLTERNKQFQ